MGAAGRASIWAMAIAEAPAAEQPEEPVADAPDETRERAVPADEIAREIGNTELLKRKSKVRAFTDLPGIPEGTAGKVALVGGWDPWIRYHVLFDNGVVLGSINRQHLVPAKDYERFARLRQVALDSGVFDEPEVDESAESEGGEGAGGGGGGYPVVNGVAIPSYLIDRSKAARERLGG